MSFVSIDFGVFFLVVSVLFFFLPFRFRWILLLIASYYFYGYWSMRYAGLMAIVTLVCWYCAVGIGRNGAGNPKSRKWHLAAAMIFSLGTLFIFKYLNFFFDSLQYLGGLFGFQIPQREFNVLLPVGISFYTFQAMSYVVDVYRNDIPAEKNPGKFATFVAFFPQLVAGPIERATNLLPQFRRESTFDYNRTVDGLILVMWGVFKKVVIADRLALYVDNVYNNLDTYSGLPLIIATVFFAIQIYCDFSAYSDIAIGTAKVLGFDLMVNFRQPYFSTSIQEFWRRWHISLSTWFRDYLYFPLGGNRVRFSRMLINLMIVFVVSGLWHGASVTFLIWGFLHGVYMVAEQCVIRFSPSSNRKTNTSRAMTALRMGFVFLLVLVAWVFFRSATLADAKYVFQFALDFQHGLTQIATPFASAMLGSRTELLLSIFLILFLLMVDYMDAKRGLVPLVRTAPIVVRWGVYYAASLGIALGLLAGSGNSQFIYFQF